MTACQLLSFPPSACPSSLFLRRQLICSRRRRRKRRRKNSSVDHDWQLRSNVLIQPLGFCLSQHCLLLICNPSYEWIKAAAAAAQDRMQATFSPRGRPHSWFSYFRRVHHKARERLNDLWSKPLGLCSLENQRSKSLQYLGTIQNWIFHLFFGLWSTFAKQIPFKSAIFLTIKQTLLPFRAIKMFAIKSQTVKSETWAANYQSFHMFHTSINVLVFFIFSYDFLQCPHSSKCCRALHCSCLFSSARFLCGPLCVLNATKHLLDYWYKNKQQFVL